MLSIGIQEHLYTVTPTLLGSDCGVLGHMWSQNDVIRSWLRLTVTLIYFPCPSQTCMKCLSTLICCPQAFASSLIVVPTPLNSDCEVLGHLLTQNDAVASWLRLTTNSGCFPHPCETYTKCLITLICCPQAYGSSLIQLYPYPYSMAQILGFWVTCEVKMMSFCHG